MKYTFINQPGKRSTVHKQAHSGEIHVETVIDDAAQIKRNQRIQHEDLMPVGTQNPLLDKGAVITTALSFPTYANFQIALRDHPEEMDQLQHGTVEEQQAAAQKLAIIYPQYVLTQEKKRAW